MQLGFKQVIRNAIFQGAYVVKLTVCGSSSKGNTMILAYNDISIILDAGINPIIVKKALNWNIRNVGFVVVTHEHSDHSKYIQHYLDMGIKVYMPRSMSAKYKSTNIVAVEERKQYVNGYFKIIPFAVPHDDVECYAYLIYVGGHRIAWLTDLEYCPYVFKKQKLTDIFCECNYQKEKVDTQLANYKHKIRGHMRDTTALEFVRVNANECLNNVILLHMNKESCDVNEVIEKMQKVAQNANVDVAEPYKTWILDKTDIVPF